MSVTPLVYADFRTHLFLCINDVDCELTPINAVLARDNLEKRLLGFAVVIKGNPMIWWTRFAATVCCGAVLAVGLPTKTTAVEAGNTHGRGVAVDVPSTHVDVRGSKKSRVKVRAPHTAVDVDTRRRRVRIDVPYYHGTIRW